MRKLKRIFPQHILCLIYIINSLIHPHLIYGLNLWGFKHKRTTMLQKRGYKNTCISSLHLTFNICLQGVKNTHVKRPWYNRFITKISIIFYLYISKDFYLTIIMAQLITII